MLRTDFISLELWSKNPETEADDLNPSVNDGFEADEPEEPVEHDDQQSNDEDPGERWLLPFLQVTNQTDSSYKFVDGFKDIKRFQRFEAYQSQDFALLAAADMSDEDNSDQIKTVFQNDQGKKTIDVYWIADDGGESDPVKSCSTFLTQEKTFIVDWFQFEDVSSGFKVWLYWCPTCWPGGNAGAAARSESSSWEMNKTRRRAARSEFSCS